MRSQDDIVSWCKAQEAGDLLGFRRGVMISFLDYDHVVQILRQPCTDAELASIREEAASPIEITRENVLAEMRDYIECAWGKALDERGISANRSVDKFFAWTWLLGDEDLAAIDWDDYAPYGRPILRAICERFDFPIPAAR